MTRAARVLIADDQRDVLEALRLLLKGEGLDSETASSPPAVLAALEARDYDAILIDLNCTRDTTSGQEGLDLLARIRELDGDLPVVDMSRSMPARCRTRSPRVNLPACQVHSRRSGGMRSATRTVRARTFSQ